MGEEVKIILKITPLNGVILMLPKSFKNAIIYTVEADSDLRVGTLRAFRLRSFGASVDRSAPTPINADNGVPRLKVGDGVVAARRTA